MINSRVFVAGILSVGFLCLLGWWAGWDAVEERRVGFRPTELEREASPPEPALGPEPVPASRPVEDVLRSQPSEVPSDSGKFWIAGRVLDGKDGPVGGARVVLVGESGVLHASVFSNEGGSFHLLVSDPGRYSVRATSPELGNSDSEEISLSEAHPSEWVTLYVGPRLHLERRVENEFGDPIFGARVTIESERRESERREFGRFPGKVVRFDGKTDSSGTFDATMVDGQEPFRLRIEFDDYLVESHVYGSIREVPDPIVLREGAALRFVLNLPGKSDAVGTQSYRLKLTGGGERVLSSGSLHDDSVAVVHAGLLAGEYRYHFSVGTFEPIQGTLPLADSETVEISYSPKSLVECSVVVLDSSGQPIEAAQVKVYSDASQREPLGSATYSDERGVAKVFGLDRDGLSLRVSAPGYLPVSLESARRQLRGRQLPVKLELAATIRVVFQRAEDTRPPTRLEHVALERIDGLAEYSRRHSVQFGSSTLFDGLKSGRYRVTTADQEQIVEVEIGESVDVTFEFEAGQ